MSDIKKLLESLDSISETKPKDNLPAPRNVVAKNAKTAGAGQHKNPRDIENTRKEKHKKDFLKDLHEAEKDTRVLRKVQEAYNSFNANYQDVAEGYWQDALKKAEADKAARKGKPFEKNPASHDRQGVYKGDKDLAGNPVPKRKEQGVAEGFERFQVGDKISFPLSQMATGIVDKIDDKRLYVKLDNGEVYTIPSSMLHSVKLLERQGVADGYEPNVVVKFSAKEYAAMSPEQKAAKQREWQQLKQQAKKRLQNFTLVDADKEQGVAEGSFDNASPMTKDSVKQDRIRSLKNLIAIAKEQGRQLRVQELELELEKLQGVAEGTLNEGVMDQLKRIYIMLVSDLPMGTPESEFLEHWQRIIQDDLGKKIDIDTLAKLRNNFVGRYKTMGSRGDVGDWHREMGQDLSEGKDDLSQYSTERLQAYVKKVSGGGVPAFGSGAKLKRVQAELKRRESGVAEELKMKKQQEFYGKNQRLPDTSTSLAKRSIGWPEVPNVPRTDDGTPTVQHRFHGKGIHTRLDPRPEQTRVQRKDAGKEKPIPSFLQKGMAETSDVSGLLAASKLNNSYIITAELAEGGTKKFRVKAQSERVALEKFKKHYAMAKVIDVTPEVQEATTMPTSPTAPTSATSTTTTSATQQKPLNLQAVQQQLKIPGNPAPGSTSAGSTNPQDMAVQAVIQKAMAGKPLDSAENNLYHSILQKANK